MKTQTIKLLTNVMINGQQASPEDKNGGVYSVTLAEARNLIARKRAIKFDGKIEETGKKAKNNEDLVVLKQIAEDLGIKYNQNIGYEKLEAKIAPVLIDKGVKLTENTSIIDAYKAFKADNTGTNENKDEVTEEELRKIAEEAEIGIDDGENIKETVETTLNEFAKDLKIEVGEEDNAKTLWEKIKEQLKANKEENK